MILILRTGSVFLSLRLTKCFNKKLRCSSTQYYFRIFSCETTVYSLCSLCPVVSPLTVKEFFLNLFVKKNIVCICFYKSVLFCKVLVSMGIYIHSAATWVWYALDLHVHSTVRTTLTKADQKTYFCYKIYF
jgi:hypothetical protein